MGPVITQSDLEFTKTSLKSVNILKNRKIVFKVLTAINCPLKTLDR